MQTSNGRKASAIGADRRGSRSRAIRWRIVTGRLHRLVAPAAAILLVAGVAASAERDAPYWVGRMEAALLPQSSLRAEAAVVTRTRLGEERIARLEIVRVQGPRRLRTLLTIEADGQPARVERIEHDGDELRRSVFEAGSRLPVSLPIERTYRVGDTEFTYEDLAFADFSPWKSGSVEARPGRGPARIAITANGYDTYGKVVAVLDTKTALPTEILYFGKASRLHRTVRFGGLEREGPYTFPTSAEAEDLATGRKSTLRLTSTLIGPEVPEAEFGNVQIQKRLQALANEVEPDVLF